MIVFERKDMAKWFEVALNEIRVTSKNNDVIKNMALASKVVQEK